MKVLVLGSGAKDHAIAWWFSRSKLIDGLFVAPGNPGTREFAVNLPEVDPSDGNQVLEVCRKYSIDFVFIGTENPLEAGVIDFLNKNGIETFGAPLYALKLESDRKFSREFAGRYNIPMPEYEVFENRKQLEDYLKNNNGKVFTIKPNSLSPSRVIINSSDPATLIHGAEKHFEKSSVIMEEHLEGLPITLSVLLDDSGHLVLPICSEYAKREHGDEDIITGGMGAICPLSLNAEIKKLIVDRIVRPTFEGMKKENLFYKGVLTFSMMLQGNQPYLLDYHVRLNDPATQTFVPIIKNDLVEIMQAMQNNTLSSIKLQTTNQSAMSVVIASEGYPLKTKTGIAVAEPSFLTLTNSLAEKPFVFFGAVQQDGNGEIRTTGGRAATVVALADNIINANAKAYENINCITFKGCWHREDIGNKFFRYDSKE